ncbi:replication initiator protein [Blackfly microvirus SF02]|uniref:Replication initiator protein n=1 Tax=Blackfly microvirus SF02 TaxID=2576452 RepID=A0A4P8PKS2_9VIRU|nr:replication initiator protein [Blackfly microvirus SF02]
MECSSPIFLPRQGETVACGYCVGCLSNSRRDWATRLYYEHRASKNAYFLTLTYEEASLPRCETGHGTLCKSDVQLFLKTIRNKHRRRTKGGTRISSCPRWFVVGEYGAKTGRPHYHAIVFNIDAVVVREIARYWKKGHCKVSLLNQKRVMYCAKYQVTRLSVDCVSTDRVLPFKICTKSSGGLGKQWLTPENCVSARLRLDGLISSASGRVPIPKYYRQRIGFTGSEKAALYERWQESYEREFYRNIESLRALGYVDPYRELAYRKEAYVGAILRRMTKASLYETI